MSERETRSSARTTLRRRRKYRRLLMLFIVIVIVGGSYGAYWRMIGQSWVKTDNAFVAGNLVPVTSQVTGVITNVLAEETQFVNKGDVVITLDANEAAATLGQARGRLGETVRRIAALFIARRQVAERLEARKARLDVVRHDMDRYKHVSPHGAIPKQIVQNAEDQLRALEADVREAEADVQALDAQIGGTSVMDHPAVELAKHQFIEAQLHYGRQQIRAPISGYVAKRKGQVGDRVSPGLTLMTIVPLEHLWIEANLRESELAQVRPGQPALIQADIYGRQVLYHGTVEGIVPGSGSVFATLPPDNATGNFIHIVQRVPIRIALDKGELLQQPMRPGLSTVTRIDVSNAGRSVWTSLTDTQEEEYHTDVFTQELQDAEALARETMGKNLRSETPLSQPNPSVSEETNQPQALAQRTNPLRRQEEQRERRVSPQDRIGESHVPSRSPDLGTPIDPLAPSTAGPGRGLFGLESGRTPPSPPLEPPREAPRTPR